MSAKRAEALNRCPNCGAPVDLDPAGRCRWCDAPVNVLSSGSPSSAGPVPETFRVAAAPGPGRQARRLIFALIIGALVAGGLLARQSLNVGVRHGADLTIAWTAPFDSSADLTTAPSAMTRAPAARASSGWSCTSVSLDPATGKAAWRHKIAEPSDNYEFRILSASPVVISDNQTGPRASAAEVRVFGPRGAVTATFPVSGIHDPAPSGPLTLDTEPTDGFGFPEVIADGALVGIAQDNSGHSALVAFGMSSGQRKWVVPLPDAVNDITLGGRAQRAEVVLVDESDPAYSLEEVDIATGKLRSLGVFRQQALDSVDSGLYAVGNDYLVVNLNGAFSNPPIAAIKA